MGIDNDLSALLPDPPPPRPARREAAIDAALRRFDGSGSEAQPAPAGTPARGGWGRPQIAALASIALVVMVSVPLWWADRESAPSGEPQSPTTADIGPPDAVRARALRAPQQTEAAMPESTALETDVPAAPLASSAPQAIPPTTVSSLPAYAPSAGEASLAQGSSEARAERAPTPAPAAPAARRAAPAAAAESAITVTGTRIQRQDFDSATPMVTADEAVLESGDWNDCTVLDQRHDINACRSSGEPLADGLALAWQGELDDAIDAFDRAIRESPDRSNGYLNRGLAYQAKGDLGRALADLNRAVARDRTSARAYYHRSLLHRARGDTARAEADAKRAIDLDPSYRAVLD